MSQSQENIQRLAERVRETWRKCRPRLMRLYDETEQVKARSLEAARRCRATTEHLQRMGVPLDQADNLAMHEWVCLPDIDESDEATLGRTAMPSTS